MQKKEICTFMTANNLCELNIRVINYRQTMLREIIISNHQYTRICLQRNIIFNKYFSKV